MGRRLGLAQKYVPNMSKQTISPTSLTHWFAPANFRLTVFAPIEGEVIVGTVHSSSPDHIRGKV